MAVRRAWRLALVFEELAEVWCAHSAVAPACGGQRRRTSWRASRRLRWPRGAGRRVRASLALEALEEVQGEEPRRGAERRQRRRWTP